MLLVIVSIWISCLTINIFANGQELCICASSSSCSPECEASCRPRSNVTFPDQVCLPNSCDEKNSSCLKYAYRTDNNFNFEIGETKATWSFNEKQATMNQGAGMESAQYTATFYGISTHHRKWFLMLGCDNITLSEKKCTFRKCYETYGVAILVHTEDKHRWLYLKNGHQTCNGKCSIDNIPITNDESFQQNGIEAIDARLKEANMNNDACSFSFSKDKVLKHSISEIYSRRFYRNVYVLPPYELSVRTDMSNDNHYRYGLDCRNNDVFLCNPINQTLKISSNSIYKYPFSTSNNNPSSLTCLPWNTISGDVLTLCMEPTIRKSSTNDNLVWSDYRRIGLKEFIIESKAKTYRWVPKFDDTTSGSSILLTIYRVNESDATAAEQWLPLDGCKDIKLSEVSCSPKTCYNNSMVAVFKSKNLRWVYGNVEEQKCLEEYCHYNASKKNEEKVATFSTANNNYEGCYLCKEMLPKVDEDRNFYWSMFHRNVHDLGPDRFYMDKDKKYALNLTSCHIHDCYAVNTSSISNYSFEKCNDDKGELACLSWDKNSNENVTLCMDTKVHPNKRKTPYSSPPALIVSLSIVGGVMLIAAAFLCRWCILAMKEDKEEARKMVECFNKTIMYDEVHYEYTSEIEAEPDIPIKQDLPSHSEKKEMDKSISMSSICSFFSKDDGSEVSKSMIKNLDADSWDSDAYIAKATPRMNHRENKSYYCSKNQF